MTGKIDVELVQELVAKLEWVEMALAGHQDQKGLLDRLESLFADTEDPAQCGALQKLEKLLTNASEIHQQLIDVQNALQEPLNHDQVNELKEAVAAAVKGLKYALQEEISDINKATKIATERVVSSASQAELSLRSASEELRTVEESLQQTLPIATQQLKSLLQEAHEALCSDHSLSSLKSKMETLAQELVLNKHSQALCEKWDELQKKFLADQAVTLQRQVEAMHELVIDTQTENLENVKKLIDLRAPSDVIVQLFQQLDVAKSENKYLKDALEKSQLASARIQRPSRNVYSLTRSTLPFILAYCGLGVIIGAGAMWGLLIGFR